MREIPAASEINRKKYADLALVVLAGGASSRMGRDKADLPFEGHSFLEHQIAKGLNLGMQEILISGYRGSLPLNFPVIPDLHPGMGPLAGMEAAFRAASCDRCLVLSIDTPLISCGELQNLIDFSQGQRERATLLAHRSTNETMKNEGNRAQSQSERIEPLIGVYDRLLYREIGQQLMTGRRSVMRLLEQVGYALYHSNASEREFANINDPEAYQKLNHIQSAISEKDFEIS